MKVTLLLIFVAVALVGCGGDPNKKANEMFVEAVQLISSAEEQTGEPAIKDYEQALTHLQKIISDYSESDLAVKLISGETLFTGKSLKEIKERVAELKHGIEEMRIAAAEAKAIAAEPASLPASKVKATEDDYPLKTCLVSDEGLTTFDKAFVHIHKGVMVKFCCEGCLDEFDEDPKKFLAKLEAAKKGGLGGVPSSNTKK